MFYTGQGCLVYDLLFEKQKKRKSPDRRSIIASLLKQSL